MMSKRPTDCANDVTAASSSSRASLNPVEVCTCAATESAVETKVASRVPVPVQPVKETAIRGISAVCIFPSSLDASWRSGGWWLASGGREWCGGNERREKWSEPR